MRFSKVQFPKHSSLHHGGVRCGRLETTQQLSNGKFGLPAGYPFLDDTQERIEQPPSSTGMGLKVVHENQEAADTVGCNQGG